MATAATWLGTAPVITNFRMMRGDGNGHEFTVVHSFGAAANVAEARFFIRTEPDGDIVLQLTLTDDAAQFDFTVSNACTISLLPENTDSKPGGKHWYDVEIQHDDGRVITFQRGFFELIPDMANDNDGVILPSPPASQQLQLIEWTLCDAWYGVFTLDSDNCITTGAILWPDGSLGTFTTVTKNTTFLVVDAFTVSHTNSGLTVTQAAVTRNSSGFVTTRPVPTVA